MMSISKSAKQDPAQKPLISYKYLTISVALSLISMGLVIYFTYTPGILEHLKMKRMPGLVLALGVVFLRIYFFAVIFSFLTYNRIYSILYVRVALPRDLSFT